MSKDTRLARVAHVLVHMSFNEGTATSETIAAMLDTNPVVVRRIMGALREGGYVSSERGPNGGWRLERPLQEITFLNIYKAFEPGSPFTIATSDDHPKCAVERSANRALSRALSEAAACFEQALSEITLDQLLPGS